MATRTLRGFLVGAAAAGLATAVAFAPADVLVEGLLWVGAAAGAWVAAEAVAGVALYIANRWGK